MMVLFNILMIYRRIQNQILFGNIGIFAVIYCGL